MKRNIVNKEIKKAKRQFEFGLMEKIKVDSKAFYTYVRSKSRTKDKIGPLLDEKGDLTSDKKSMCDILNRYFSTVFTEENKVTLPEAELMKNSCQPDKIVEKLLNIDINDEVIIKVIKSIKSNKAAGVDEINSTYLLGIANSLIDPHKLLFRSH